MPLGERHFCPRCQRYRNFRTFIEVDKITLRCPNCKLKIKEATLSDAPAAPGAPADRP